MARWKIHHLWMIFPLKPPFTWDFPASHVWVPKAIYHHGHFRKDFLNLRKYYHNFATGERMRQSPTVVPNTDEPGVEGNNGLKEAKAPAMVENLAGKPGETHGIHSPRCSDAPCMACLVYIYLQNWVMFGGKCNNVGKSSSTMELLESWKLPWSRGWDYLSASADMVMSHVMVI